MAEEGHEAGQLKVEFLNHFCEKRCPPMNTIHAKYELEGDFTLQIVANKTKQM